LPNSGPLPQISQRAAISASQCLIKTPNYNKPASPPSNPKLP